MDDPNMAQNVDAGEDTSVSITPIEEPKATEEVEEPKVEVTAETAGETIETVESPKKGAEARIRELNARAKKAEAETEVEKEKAASLAKRIEELTGSVEPQMEYPSFTPQVEPGEEITPEQYEIDIMRKADALVQLRWKQKESLDRINLGAQSAIKTYPQLDPESESFDRELSDSVTEAVEGYISKNIYNADVKKFVYKLMKPYNRAVTKEVGKVSETIAKQASETALRPTSVKSIDEDDSNLSISELEKKYGVVY